MMILIGFGWAKPVPINPNNFKNRKVGMALSSLAGPVSNLIMAYIAMIIYKVISFNFVNSEVMYNMAVMFAYMVSLNIGLAVFNMLPIPPLDGSRIFSLFLNEKSYFNIMRFEKYIFVILVIVMYSGILSTPLAYLRNGVLHIMDILTFFLGRIY